MRPGEIALERANAGLTILSMTGEHDLSTAPELRRTLEGLIAEGNPIVVDLSRASFVDSSILGAILAARRSAGEAGLGFAVAHEDGDEAVGRVLEITGLRAELPVHALRREAEAAASGGVERAVRS